MPIAFWNSTSARPLLFLSKLRKLCNAIAAKLTRPCRETLSFGRRQALPAPPKGGARGGVAKPMGAMDGPGIFVEGFVTGKPYIWWGTAWFRVMFPSTNINQSSVSILKLSLGWSIVGIEPPGASSLEFHLFHHSDLLFHRTFHECSWYPEFMGVWVSRSNWTTISWSIVVLFGVKGGVKNGLSIFWRTSHPGLGWRDMKPLGVDGWTLAFHLKIRYIPAYTCIPLFYDPGNMIPVPGPVAPPHPPPMVWSPSLYPRPHVYTLFADSARNCVLFAAFGWCQALFVGYSQAFGVSDSLFAGF